MGALFFYHVVEVSIAPKNPPIIIPPAGGTFRFEATITNISDRPVTIDAWTVASVPGVGYHGPLLKQRVRLSPYQSLRVPSISQEVPGYAPAGAYYYIGYVGFYPDKMDSSSFAFFKTGKSVGGKWSVGSWSGGVAEAGLPATATLLGNYPNPFNSSTTINYQLPYSAEVKLEVFDLVGQKVATLVDGNQEAGYKSVGWEASQVSSGVYFYRLTAGDYSQTKGMLLIK